METNAEISEVIQATDTNVKFITKRLVFKTMDLGDVI